MRRLRQLIPSGNLFYVFEAAARLESFKNAADELNVTPAAVSHAVRQLESSLKVPLFERSHRQLRLTNAGQRLFQIIASSLDLIERVAGDISPGAESTAVKVHASITVATYWLMPRMEEISALGLPVEVQLYSSDKSLELPNDGNSLAITGGRVDWNGYDVALFAREKIFPICSPAYIARHGPIADLKDLASRHLLHLDSGHHDGVTWLDFLFAFDRSLAASERGRIYNNYILVLHAAIAGEGIALGWEHVVAPLLQNGTLVSPLDISFSSGSDFYVVARKGQKLGAKAQAVWDLLIGSSSQT